jgi:hypothetical protein
MHNWPGALVVSIETASLKGLRGNTSWLQFLEAAAVARGGRPHWGQITKLTEPGVANLYGPQLMRWREALLAFSGTSTLFSNDFTRQRGLEPAGLLRQVTRTRKESRGGARVNTHLCPVGPGARR